MIYDDILTAADEHDLDDLVCTILDAFARRWFRLTGVPDRYLTVTIAGDDATQVVHALQAHLASFLPKAWRIVDSAIVELPR